MVELTPGLAENQVVSDTPVQVLPNPADKEGAVLKQVTIEPSTPSGRLTNRRLLEAGGAFAGGAFLAGAYFGMLGAVLGSLIGFTTVLLTTGKSSK